MHEVCSSSSECSPLLPCHLCREKKSQFPDITGSFFSRVQYYKYFLIFSLWLSSGCQTVISSEVSIYRNINTEMGTEVGGYVYVYYGCVCAFTCLYTYTDTQTLTSQLSPLRDFRSIKTTVAMGIPGKKTPFSTERKWASLEKCVIPVLC